ncbi:hypothetical protein [Butyricicoccus sp. AF18-9LB]|uniref:hypothetical protein n=1 Tax=Butyricicoccus sp. AF18-9LB TaxID=3002521 RepID=UPI0022E91003|nr:hypothetical protein [Butyricicoccus sp. AF18-9LB]
MNALIREKGGTFSLNKNEPIHRWYSYIEGYSSCLIAEELKMLLSLQPDIKTIYDPFCGTGTTSLVAATHGIKSFYSESNPFMQSVIETKINCVRNLDQDTVIPKLIEYLALINTIRVENHSSWNGFEKFFGEKQLNELLTIKGLIFKEDNESVKNILALALSSIVVKVSKMIRRGDLRYATEKEYREENVLECFADKVNEIIFDIQHHKSIIKCGTVKVSDDARDNDYVNAFDCVITSPPYLNGTNYIRNTKLELKLNDFITSESDLPRFHSKGIIAGINNVSKRTVIDTILPVVEPYLEQLQPVSYDDRIPKMVAGYFRDMDTVIQKLSKSVKPGGLFTMDIGDSQFAGVHIPTHQILSNICVQYGFSLYDEEILRKRRSKNGMILTQRLLRYRLEK